jgi:hypothetical protein
MKDFIKSDGPNHRRVVGENRESWPTKTAVGIMDGADLPQTPGRSTSGLTHISDADQLSGLHCIIGFAFEPRRPSKGQLCRR